MIIRKILVYINIFVAFLLLLCYISVHLSPETISFIAVFGLIYPVLLIINLFFIALWIFKKKIAFIFSLIAIVLGFNHFLDFFSFGKSERSNGNSLKVLSYNVRLFDLYNWHKESNTTDRKILKLIKDQDADIICLQEFYSNSDKQNYQDSVIQNQKTKSYLISYKNGGNYSGNAIFSKYPIVKKGYVNIGISNQKCIFADIVKGEDTIRVYSVHLASIHLSHNDYDIIDSIEYNDHDKNIEGVKGISYKILKAYKKRAAEADVIAAHIKNSPYKVIVCGDFNDVPISYAYRKIKGKLTDAFTEAGFGIGSTFAHRFLFFRIDYILHSPDIKSFGYMKITEPYSDHYPIVCKVEIY